MRRPIRGNIRKAQIAVSRSVPAPVGGWDTESPLAAMPPKNAVILDNWIPRAADIEMRRGCVQHVSGFANPVEALMAWRGDPIGDKLFACASTSIYDVTSAGSLTSAVYVSATSARWKSENFSNDAGAFLIAVNGADTPIYYNGTAFANLAITGTAAGGSIVLDPKDLSHVMAHKRRLFWIEKGTLRVWFLAVVAIQGASQLLDLGPIFNMGGHLVAEGTWSLDSGQGQDDMAVFLTSEGQIAVYQGNDPADADNWSLVGVYNVAKPIGETPLIKWGADLAVITEDGVLPLSQALSKNREEAKKIALTAKIATACAQAAQSYKDLFGWSGTLYSGRGSLAIINVPTAELQTAEQYVQSIQTGAWCRFTGLNAICWETANDAIYFGGPTAVLQWDVGASDNGETITSDVKPAFSAFGSSNTKQFTMIRPLMKAPLIIKPFLEVLTDYRESIPTAVPTVVDPGDISQDDQSAIRYEWTTATGIGYVGAPRMRVKIVSDNAVSRVAVDTTDLVITETAGDYVITRPNLPLDVEVRVIGWDLMFITGGQV